MAKGLKARAYILGHSATSVLKWMGKEGWSLEAAWNAVRVLSTNPIARSSIMTAMADGKNPTYNTSGVAPLAQSDIDKLLAASLGPQSGNNRDNAANVSDAEVEQLRQRVSQLEASHRELRETRKVEITVKTAEQTVTLKDEHLHPVFEQVMFHLSCGDNVMLVGPKGCGKTHIAEQVAKALKLSCHAMSLSGGVTEGKVFGRVVPNINTGKSEFQGTQVVESYEKGGVVLLDEVDAADPNVLLSLNLALSNGKMVVDRVKNPTINRHEKFVCLAAANTWGHGADRQYVGRNQQDSAFTERFVQISMDYDKGLEQSLCADVPNMLESLWRYRENIAKNKLEKTISTRFMLRARNWIINGKDQAYVDQMLFAGWRADEVRKATQGF